MDNREAEFLKIHDDLASIVRFYEAYGIGADEAEGLLLMVRDEDRAELERLMFSWKIAPLDQPTPPRSVLPTTSGRLA